MCFPVDFVKILRKPPGGYFRLFYFLLLMILHSTITYLNKAYSNKYCTSFFIFTIKNSYKIICCFLSIEKKYLTDACSQPKVNTFNKIFFSSAARPIEIPSEMKVSTTTVAETISN